MSKYDKISRNKDGNAKWFLQRTLLEHDKSMDHPWMQMIYGQTFQVKQYCEWLARLHALFEELEKHLGTPRLKEVHDEALLRTPGLEVDLRQLLGEGWRAEARAMAEGSKATQQYLDILKKESTDAELVLSHHFLQYNAVLSGGAYQGEMVCKKFCVPPGAPGVQFYAFEGVKSGMEPARVQKYLRAFDGEDLDESARERMLPVMKRIYAETEALMDECHALNPVAGVAYNAGGASGPPAAIPVEEHLELEVSELHGFLGDNNGRILMSLAGELLDITAGREMYGPGGSYSLLAGRDVTRCLATMSLEPSELDDLTWKPESDGDANTLKSWQEKLKAKYPVAGKLNLTSTKPEKESWLRMRKAPAKTEAQKTEATAEATDAKGSVCPISGKEGSCPMSSIIGLPPKKETIKVGETSGSTGFMAGKSMVNHTSLQHEEASSWEGTFIYAICPLHWDDKTIKLLIGVAVSSWVTGVLAGWKLHQQLNS